MKLNARRGLFISLALASALAACSADKGPSEASASTATAAATTAAAATTTATAAAADKPSATADATASAAPIDVGEIMKDSADDAAGINVKLGDIKDDAPPLGGVEKAPEAKSGATLEWVDVGPLQFVNPGWGKHGKGDVGVLVSEDRKAGVAFTGFDTEANGTKKVVEMTQQFGWKNVKWSKPKAVKVGIKEKFPALVRSGVAVDDKGKPMKLVLALIKTGAPINVLALGGADADAPESEQKLPLMIMATPKKR